MAKLYSLARNAFSKRAKSILSSTIKRGICGIIYNYSMTFKAEQLSVIRTYQKNQSSSLFSTLKLNFMRVKEINFR
jgi:hypothetical protein